VPDNSSKEKSILIIAVIESALAVQVILTMVADPTKTRIMASLIELVVIAAALFVAWSYILGRK
jgi:hypothetical protein